MDRRKPGTIIDKSPSKNKVQLSTYAYIGFGLIGLGFAIGELMHIVNATSDTLTSSAPTAILGTPEPDTVDRLSISYCIEQRPEEYCVEPVSFDETKDIIAVSSKMLMENSNLMSPNSFTHIFGESKKLYDMITSFQNGDPGAITFFSNLSLFPEAEGGSSRLVWELATATPNVEVQSSNTPETVAINPELHLYLPRMEKDANGDMVINAKNMMAIGTYFHENYHLGRAIERWETTGTFKPSDLPYSDPKYTALMDAEEYEATFYGDVAQMSLIKAYGLESEYYAIPDRAGEMKRYGFDLGSIEYFLDQNNITPDNPICPLLYDILFVKSPVFSKHMYDLTGDKSYLDEFNEASTIWNSYPWSDEERSLMETMMQQGLREGWILPDSIPPIPEPTSLSHGNEVDVLVQELWGASVNPTGLEPVTFAM